MHLAKWWTGLFFDLDGIVATAVNANIARELACKAKYHY